MPKKHKTRKEKIQSSNRKAAQIGQVYKKKEFISDEDILTVPVKFIKKDLLKTLFISLLFIFLIFALYFLNQKGILSLF